MTKELTLDEVRARRNRYQQAWREKQRAGRPRRELRPCGTVAAYRRHKYHGEEPCVVCRAAYLADQARLYRQRKARRAEQTP